ncbi:ribosomal RNA large subunit methyltransferase H [Erysipelotrichaceae bacterium]|nr:ribosomal RNA large subunit methyltransferase H [Erysipelotrichaceae bacterium]
MLKIEVLALGNLKEKYWKDAIAEYQKRLKRFCKFEIIELKEESISDMPSHNEIEIALSKEAIQLLKKIQKDDYVVALAIDGEQQTSEGFAKTIGKFEQMGKKIIFIIGSSHGLSQSVYERANIKVSCSKMTFPHQMLRLIFIEQLYRGYKINRNEKYHK